MSSSRLADGGGERFDPHFGDWELLLIDEQRGDRWHLLDSLVPK